jgi:hypothetical protein
MRALVLLAACAFALAGCEGILGINEHTLEDGGGPPVDGSVDGSKSDSGDGPESGAADSSDAGSSDAFGSSAG